MRQQKAILFTGWFSVRDWNVKWQLTKQQDTDFSLLKYTFKFSIAKSFNKWACVTLQTNLILKLSFKIPIIAFLFDKEYQVRELFHNSGIIYFFTEKKKKNKKKPNVNEWVVWSESRLDKHADSTVITVMLLQ